ncbi:hypothetical protein [Sphingomonas sp. Y38-1Y]|uniref:hypothetical protein n=1 Tax=Sphingomonas sp. Y38-1Y TaxID=3078265 RepID=UPI0028EF34BB|nr:hypothetical protein [Sphingomonas sp. Y38-1Y]
MIALALIAAQAAAVYPQGGAIGLVPPPGMTAAEGFTGFADTAGGSIVVAELPAEAYAELVARIDAAKPGEPLPNGIVLDGSGTVPRLADGVEAKRWRGHQTVGGQRYAKWLLIAKSGATTAIVTAQLPEAGAAAGTAAIEAALATLRIRQPAEIEAAVAALPFAIGDRAGYRPVRTLMGSGLILTDGPRDTDPDGAQPVVVVAASIDGRPIADPEAYARQLFEAQPGFTRLKVVEARRTGDDVVVAGTAVDRARVVSIRQHLRLQPAGGYVRTVCIWPVADDLAARCDRLAGSIRPK